MASDHYLLSAMMAALGRSGCKVETHYARTEGIRSGHEAGEFVSQIGEMFKDPVAIALRPGPPRQWI